MHRLLPAHLDRGRVERRSVQPRLDQERAATAKGTSAVLGQGAVLGGVVAEHGLRLPSNLGQGIRYVRASLGGVGEDEQPAPTAHGHGGGPVHGELNAFVKRLEVVRRESDGIGKLVDRFLTAPIRRGRFGSGASNDRRLWPRGLDPWVRAARLEFARDVRQLGRPSVISDVDRRGHRIAQSEWPAGEGSGVRHEGREPGAPGDGVDHEAAPRHIDHRGVGDDNHDDIRRLDAIEGRRPRSRWPQLVRRNGLHNRGPVLVGEMLERPSHIATLLLVGAEHHNSPRAHSEATTGRL